MRLFQLLSRFSFQSLSGSLLLLATMPAAGLLAQSAQTARPAPISSQVNAPPPALAEVLSGGYEVQTMDGKRVKLARLLGKNQPVLINFWATWCGPCRMEMPHLVEIAEKYRQQGLLVIGLTIEDPKEALDAVKAFTKKYGINYQIAFAPAELYQEFSRSGRRAIPQTYVYAGDGTAIRKIVGFNPNLIRSLLTQAVEAALAHKAENPGPSAK